MCACRAGRLAGAAGQPRRSPGRAADPAARLCGAAGGGGHGVDLHRRGLDRAVQRPPLGRARQDAARPGTECRGPAEAVASPECGLARTPRVHAGRLRRHGEVPEAGLATRRARSPRRAGTRCAGGGFGLSLGESPRPRTALVHPCPRTCGRRCRRSPAQHRHLHDGVPPLQPRVARLDLRPCRRRRDPPCAGVARCILEFRPAGRGSAPGQFCPHAARAAVFRRAPIRAGPRAVRSPPRPGRPARAGAHAGGTSGRSGLVPLSHRRRQRCSHRRERRRRVDRPRHVRGRPGRRLRTARSGVRSAGRHRRRAAPPPDGPRALGDPPGHDAVHDRSAGSNTGSRRALNVPTAAPPAAPERGLRCVALLDDRDASHEQPTSRAYSGFVHEHRCTDPATLAATWAAVDADLRRGLHALLLVDYEWGAKLLRAGLPLLPAGDHSSLRVLMFANCERLSRSEADQWLDDLASRVGDAGLRDVAGVMNLEASVDKLAFTQAIARIHEAIRAGETYQINYSYRLHGQAYGSPVQLYRRLRALQPVAYGAYIELPCTDDGTPACGDETTHVLSCSPELFLRHDDGLLTARPMKGTASRTFTPEADSETARHLSLDVKNRAENLMIVDLLRNDLGRIAKTGSVQVPELFAIEPYSTVFQMTSTVQARVRPEVDFPALLRAVFPCGSITGAPKHHTMEWIARLESTPRGLYCGAIGWMSAPRGDARLGDFCLSVAIRTLTLGAASQGRRPARLGIGAGIVLDSRADEEFEECRLKARFLTGVPPGFALFETLRATPEQGVAHLALHLDRLGRSAQALGFVFDRDAAWRLVESQWSRLSDAPHAPHRLRLSLNHDGRLQLTQAVLNALPPGSDGADVSLLVAPHRLPNAQPLSAHKTTLRQHYDEGVQVAERAGAFDSLFFTEDGRLVEGGRTSVFLRLDGGWYTPPVADGALPGVMRGLVLADAQWQAAERSLGTADLARAEAIMVCNALRGTLSARLIAG
ncbi:MAG: hypothetical protein CFE40_10900 [Burkholderiales bacterium PBB1]|nr:MAG: hypothetical protein CFE40_10900 [Burkholderiales bacterium PBB1]